MDSGSERLQTLMRKMRESFVRASTAPCNVTKMVQSTEGGQRWVNFLLVHVTFVNLQLARTRFVNLRLVRMIFVNLQLVRMTRLCP